MINEKDVVVMKIPYPTISSGLVLTAHMYVCESKNIHDCKFVKCQTFKPYHIALGLVSNYVKEQQDPNRNPFSHTTLIDCDKLFTSHSLVYGLSMRTFRRPNVSNDLLRDIRNKLNSYNYLSVDIESLTNINNILSMNPSITRVTT